jgi:TPR repeat protein
LIIDNIRNGWKADISRVNVACGCAACSTHSSRRRALICKVCDKFWDDFSAYSDAWERAASNEDQLLSAESSESWALIQRAAEIEEVDGDSAFRLYREAAEAGSVWSLERVGWHYWTGTGVAADRQIALDYYYRAICGGSWRATIHYARLLAELDRFDDCERTLEDGVASGFVPAYFWLAWLRYKRSETAKVRREVRPLLDQAATLGHPEAKMLLARWMMLGKLELRDIPRGWRWTLEGAWSFAFRGTHAAAP